VLIFFLLGRRRKIDYKERERERVIERKREEQERARKKMF
jgi:hypothetical protein